MIAAEGLGKRFGQIWALQDVTFATDAGRVVSILGPNGAGKTTLVRILITELLPTRGRAYVAGHDVVKEAEKIRRKIAAVPQEGSPIGFLTPYEFVYAYLLLRGYSRREARRRTEGALAELQLSDVRGREIQTLSGGTKRRVLLAAVLAADVDVVFLDEPTTGLDVLSRRIVWNAVSSMRRGGVTVLLTTHYVEEAQTLSDYVVLMNRGRVVDAGPPRSSSGEGAGQIRGRGLRDPGRQEAPYDHRGQRHLFRRRSWRDSQRSGQGGGQGEHKAEVPRGLRAV
jgi:ABC-type multidrug transport system, ATPase component